MVAKKGPLKKAAVKTARPSQGESSTPDQIMSIRIDGPLHARLRKLAFDRRQTMRDFIVRGIESVLKEEGY